MLNFLLVTKNRKDWSEFILALEQEGVTPDYADSGRQALDLAAKNQYALLIADVSIEDLAPLKLVSDLLKVNPMINTAVVSDLPEDDFHEESEGLGILLQLPVNPGKAEAARAVEKTRRILGLMS